MLGMNAIHVSPYYVLPPIGSGILEPPHTAVKLHIPGRRDIDVA
jgi:hypothetical protein